MDGIKHPLRDSNISRAENSQRERGGPGETHNASVESPGPGNSCPNYLLLPALNRPGTPQHWRGCSLGVQVGLRYEDRNPPVGLVGFGCAHEKK